MASTATLDIEAWTVSALESLSVSTEARGTGIPFSIPLDNSIPAPRTNQARVSIDPGLGGIAPPRRPPSRRDSQRRRELVAKGNEGSRQRRRWENDRLVHVPGAQPPEPIDFQVGPTHVVHDYVPYHVAQLWDRGLRDQIEEDRARAAALKRKRQQQIDAGLLSAGAESCAVAVGRVPRELRATAKKTPALKGWVRTLEEPVRQFLVEEDARIRADAAEKERKRLEKEKEARAASEGESGLDSEDEEIVFIGRRQATPQKSSGPGWKKAHRETRDKGAIDSGVVFDSLGDDESSAFKYAPLYHLARVMPAKTDMKSVIGDGLPTRFLTTMAFHLIRQPREPRRERSYMWGSSLPAVARRKRHSCHHSFHGQCGSCFDKLVVNGERSMLMCMGKYMLNKRGTFTRCICGVII